MITEKTAKKERSVNLNLPVNQNFLPVIISFAEKSAEIFRLGEKEKFQLVLATDEVFTYLCQHSKSQDIINIRCTDITYSVKIEFIFPVNELNLKMFNITSTISPDSKDDIEELGIFIASRSVDRFQIINDHHGNMILTLYKDRKYPHIKEIIIDDHEELEEDFIIKEASPEQVKKLLYKIVKHYPDYLYPENFYYPGKITDMMSEGIYHIYVVLDKCDRVAGGILCNSKSQKIAQTFGPYIFNIPEPSSICERLMNICINNLVRSEITGIFTIYLSAHLPVNYFESLRSITLYRESQNPVIVPAFYREIKEDPGGHIWINPLIETFIKEEYKKLFLARYMDKISNTGESKPEYSVFSSEIDRENNEVRLYPVWPGRDMEENLIKHIETFVKENLINIFCFIDLASSWQVEFITDLVKHNFSPKLLFPYGGKSDLVIFQYEIN
ncbi:MAG: hypothetical protein ABRQ38_16795 [Candidatus Eremiobacterota bacterium]